MIRQTSLKAVLLILLLTACDFDEEGQRDIRLPATVILENASGQPVAVESIFSAPDSQQTFSLGGGNVPPDGTLETRISEATYDAIASGMFVVQGSCGGNPEWQANGRTLERINVRDAQKWLVTIIVKAC